MWSIPDLYLIFNSLAAVDIRKRIKKHTWSVAPGAVMVGVVQSRMAS